MSARKCHGCGAFFSVKASTCPDCGATYESHKSTSIPVGDAADKYMGIIGGPRVAAPKPCMAHGCPLSGTFNPIIYDEGKSKSWQCFIHSDLAMSQWQEATATINRHIARLRTIPEDRAFRAAMRDAVAGKEVSEKYWSDDGVTHNAYLDSIRAARKK